MSASGQVLIGVRPGVNVDRKCRKRMFGGQVLRRLLEWHARVGQRRALSALDDRLLRDVGLTPGQAHAECAKPFWKP